VLNFVYSVNISITTAHPWEVSYGALNKNTKKFSKSF
jgi:hypothetical protein